jgi:hypothetical protein
MTDRRLADEEEMRFFSHFYMTRKRNDAMQKVFRPVFRAVAADYNPWEALR